MTKEEKAAKIEAVCARYGLQVPQNDEGWKALAIAVMTAREPEFQDRGKPGRPPSLSEVEDFVCHLMFYYIRQRWNIAEDIRERKFTVDKLEACRQLAEAVKIPTETLKSRLARYQRTTKAIKIPVTHVPGFVAQLHEERDKANKILKSYLELHPEYEAEVEDFMLWFNEYVDNFRGEN